MDNKAISTTHKEYSIKDYIHEHGMPSADTDDILYLNNIKLTSLDGFTEISDLNNVVCLALSLNNIKTIPEGCFDKLENLLVLDLSANLLETLPSELFYKLHMLESLDLSVNKLKELPNLTKLSKLQSLILIDNSLMTPSKNSFSSLINLHTLLMNNNNNAIITPDFFDNLPELKILDYDNNPNLCTNFT